MMANSKAALLALPAELRNLIYEYVLTTPVRCNVVLPPDVDYKHHYCESVPCRGCTVQLDWHPTLPGLLQTCRTIRHDAMGIFLSTAVFVSTEPNTIVRFLTCLSPQHRSLIKHLRYDPAPIRELEDSLGPSHWHERMLDPLGALEERAFAILRARLRERKIFLKENVLLVSIVWGPQFYWTGEPVETCRELLEPASSESLDESSEESPGESRMNSVSGV